VAFNTESPLPSISRAKGRIGGRKENHHKNIWSYNLLRFYDISPRHIRFGNQLKPESGPREIFYPYPCQNRGMTSFNLGWKSEVITSSHHILIVIFLKITRKPWEDMKIICAVFSGPMISEDFGKIISIFPFPFSCTKLLPYANIWRLRHGAGPWPGGSRHLWPASGTPFPDGAGWVL
jgi:hypothetical protein